MSLRDDQLDRYARHIVLPEIGGAGQGRLLAARVVIVGAGGVGSPAIQYLAAAGVGRLTIVDDDRVDIANLQRQTLYTTGDIGMPKAALAARAVAALNPDVAVAVQAVRLDRANARGLIDGADAVLDGSDSFATRLAVADAALAARVPLVSAAVAGFTGQLATYRGWEGGKPCYRCFVGNAADLPERSCAEQGVLGALAGVMGSLAALEVLRVLAPFGSERAGQLLLVDALTMRLRSLALAKDPGCPACAG